MRKIKIKVPAKINLTLDVVGKSGEYHNLKTLVASINLFDAIAVKKRKDGKISVKFSGFPVGVAEENSNCYKVAEKIVKEYKTAGVDIFIKRGIPSSAGLGGSSADSAGVILALKKLFSLNFDPKKYAENFGSDTPYMTVGGFAVLKGRGENIEKVSGDKFYLNLIFSDKGVSTKDCFDLCDKNPSALLPKTDFAVKSLEEKDFDNFLKVLKNDLYSPAVSLVPEIKENAERLKRFGTAVMTGSGSAVYGIYRSKALRNYAFIKLKKTYGKNIVKAETL